MRFCVYLKSLKLFLFIYSVSLHFKRISSLMGGLQDSPVVPIGKSPRTDILLKAEKNVLDAGGCVVRLAGLYISF